MSEPISFYVTPHLNTTNIYVKQLILQDNISNIKIMLNNRTEFPLNAMERYALSSLLIKQQHALKDVLKQIRDAEQSSFPFGG